MQQCILHCLRMMLILSTSCFCSVFVMMLSVRLFVLTAYAGLLMLLKHFTRFVAILSLYVLSFNFWVFSIRLPVSFISLMIFSQIRLLLIFWLTRRMVMMMFRSAFDHGHAITAPVGDRIKKVYLTTQDANGIHRKLIEEVDTYCVIQSFANTVDVHQILAKYKQTQDPSLLFRRAAVYTDVAGLPTNLSQARLAMDAAKKAYDGLDSDVRGAISFDDLLANPSRLGDIVVKLANKRPAAVNPTGGDANA